MKPAGEHADHRRSVHDLMNHLTVILGHSELLAMELGERDPARAPVLEILQACRSAVDLVEGWSRPG